jgi:hypothetical protein
VDEALGLAEYLPISYKTQSEGEYVEFLWSAFESNYLASKFEFASLAFHLLYMSYVSFSIWQIRLARHQAFRFALVGFQNESENDLLAADSPFKFYEKLKESQIFRFLKLIGCENAQVGEFAKFVKRRNKIAHPTGTVFFNDQQAIDDELSEMMAEVRNIENHMRPVVLEIYQTFLIESANPDEREYGPDSEEIEANLIHKYYFSTEDVRICHDFSIDLLTGRPDFEMINTLHRCVLGKCGELFG